MLTHRVPSECLLSFLHLPQLECHILFPGQTLQMTALSPRKTHQNKEANRETVTTENKREIKHTFSHKQPQDFPPSQLTATDEHLIIPLGKWC